MTQLALRNLFLVVLAIAVCGTIPVFAGTISYACAPNIGGGPTGLCNYLNTTIAGLYGNTFTNANANIYIKFGSTGLGASQQYLGATTYGSYFSQLSSESTDAQALASLPAAEPSIFNNGYVVLTTALAQALGFIDTIGTTAGGAFCTLGNTGCYYGVITISNSALLWYRGLSGGSQPGNAYDFFSVVQHETDEILGTISCVATNSGLYDACGGSNAAAADLFRYSGAGQRDFFNTNPAYFSPNDGVTDTAGNQYNHIANGEDYADFSSTCTFVQDAVGCPGGSLNITTDGPGGTLGPEAAILNAVGYDETVPEPASMVLLGSGLLGLAARRGQKRRCRR